MHRHCLSCSADLGANEVVEALPIGRRIAFDAWKGRVWVVCRRCRRWNLIPIEERWEPVEALERLFSGCRTRVQSENIGLAKLPDGTTLIRIGQALPGELAAWRYGSELRRRRWRAGLILGTFGGVVTGVALAGPLGLAAVAIPGGLVNVVVQGFAMTRNVLSRRRLVYRLEAGASPTGQELLLRRRDFDGAVLSLADDGRPALWLPVALDPDPAKRRRRTFAPQQITARDLHRVSPLVLEGERAVRALGRAMVVTNEMGGSHQQVKHALLKIENAGGSDGYVRELARRDAALEVTSGKRRSRIYRKQGLDLASLEDLPGPLRARYTSGAGEALDKVDALALEMALHEEKERRALEGELAALEEEWCEAEMLATIADALPDEPPAPR